jgi:hypothetical protein
LDTTRFERVEKGLCEILRHISKNIDEIVVKTSKVDPSITYKRSPPAAFIYPNLAYYSYKSGILRESQCPNKKGSSKLRAVQIVGF